MNPRQHHGQVGEDLHFLRKFVINVVVREACILKAVVHSLEGLHHRRNTFIEYDLVEAQLLEDGQVVIPEFYGTVEDQPRLACLRPKLDGLDDVLGELDLPLMELGPILVCEVSFVLVPSRVTRSLWPISISSSSRYST